MDSAAHNTSGVEGQRRSLTRSALCLLLWSLALFLSCTLYCARSLVRSLSLSLYLVLTWSAPKPLLMDSKRANGTAKPRPRPPDRLVRSD